MRLVVAGRDNVRDADRVPPVLLGESPGDVHQDHEVEGDARLPAGGAHLGGGQGDHSEVRQQFKIDANAMFGGFDPKK